MSGAIMRHESLQGRHLSIGHDAQCQCRLSDCSTGQPSMDCLSGFSVAVTLALFIKMCILLISLLLTPLAPAVPKIAAVRRVQHHTGLTHYF